MFEMMPDDFASLLTLATATIFLVGIIAIVIWLRR